MENYEGLFILDADLGPDASKAAVQSVSDTITRNGGTITEAQEWGKRKLAYIVKKKREGNYVLVQFSSNTDAVAKMNTQYLLNEQILKYLVTRKELPRKFRALRQPIKAAASV